MTQQLKSFKDLALDIPPPQGMEGPKIDMNKLFGREITVHGFDIKPSTLPGKEGTKCLHLQIALEGNKRVVFSGSKYLMEVIAKVPKDAFPFRTIIVKKDNDSHQFT